MLRLARTLVLLVGLAIGVDRAAAYWVSLSVADRIQAADHLPVRPGVDIQGFPFLTQLAAGRFPEVDVTVRGYRDGPLATERIAARLHQVRVPVGAALRHRSYRIQIGSANGTVLFSYPNLDDALAARGLRVSYAGHGEVQVSGRVSLFGRTFSATGTGAVRVVANRLQVDVVRLRAGPVDTPALGHLLSISEPVPPLPFGLRLLAVTTARSGISVGASIGAVSLRG